MHEKSATVKVYATAQGHEVRIGNHGTATYDVPCLVPECVAQQLEEEIAGEREVERPKAKGNGTETVVEKFAVKRWDLRVERDAPAAPAKDAAKKLAGGQSDKAAEKKPAESGGGN